MPGGWATRALPPGGEGLPLTAERQEFSMTAFLTALLILVIDKTWDEFRRKV